jgi:plastocyanin
MRKPIAIAGITLAVLAGACSGGNDAPECSAPTSGAEMQLLDFEFAPACLEVTGDTVSLRNDGAVGHTFTIPDTEIDVRVEAGEEGSADLGGLAAGTYEVICTLHPQMTSTLRIA